MDNKNGTAKDVVGKLIEIIIENGGLQDKNVNITKESALSEIGISSFDFIKIIVGIEVEFGFEFDDEKLNTNNFITVKELAEYILEKE